LYRTDPSAFEARRQAVLAIELAKAAPGPARMARGTLQRLEERLEGQSDAERLRTSMLYMAASMRLLGNRMTDLAAATAQARSACDKLQ
jgi:hypothetical protein